MSFVIVVDPNTLFAILFAPPKPLRLSVTFTRYVRTYLNVRYSYKIHFSNCMQDPDKRTNKTDDE